MSLLEEGTNFYVNTFRLNTKLSDRTHGKVNRTPALRSGDDMTVTHDGTSIHGNNRGSTSVGTTRVDNGTVASTVVGVRRTKHVAKFVSGDNNIVGRVPKVLTPVSVNSRVRSLLISTEGSDVTETSTLGSVQNDGDIGDSINVRVVVEPNIKIVQIGGRRISVIETKILEHEGGTEISFVNSVNGREEGTNVVGSLSNSTIRETCGKLSVGLNYGFDLDECGSTNTVGHDLFDDFKLTFHQVSLLFFMVKTFMFMLMFAVLVTTWVNNVSIAFRRGIDLHEVKTMFFVVSEHVVFSITVVHHADRFCVKRVDGRKRDSKDGQRVSNTVPVENRCKVNIDLLSVLNYLKSVLHSRLH